MHQVWPRETATFSFGNKVSFFPTLTASTLPFLNGRGTVFFLQPYKQNLLFDHLHCPMKYLFWSLCLDCQLCTSALCTPWKSNFLLKIIHGYRLRRQHNSSAAASICIHARKNSPSVPDHKIVSHLIHQRFEKAIQIFLVATTATVYSEYGEGSHQWKCMTAYYQGPWLFTGSLLSAVWRLWSLS